MRATTRGLLGLLVLAPLTALGATVYVTDNLRLGLHQAPDTSDRAFRYMDSGQEMEVLTRDRNYANVRLPDATEGWVKAAYLVDDFYGVHDSDNLHDYIGFFKTVYSRTRRLRTWASFNLAKAHLGSESASFAGWRSRAASERSEHLSRGAG